MAGNYSDFLYGPPEKLQQINTLLPQQTQWQNALGAQASQGMQNIGNLSFDPIEKRARSAYERDLPNILAQFQAGNGNSNPYSGSALGSILEGGKADLEERLAALRSGHDMNAYSTLLGGLNTALRPQFETRIEPGQQGALGAFGGEFAKSAGGNLAKSLFGPKDETESSTGFGDYIKQLFAALLKYGGGAVGGALGGPGGAAAGGALGSVASDFLTPQQASYQRATGQPVKQSPFPGQKPPLTLQQMRYQQLTGQAPLQAPFTKPFGG